MAEHQKLSARSDPANAAPKGAAKPHPNAAQLVALQRVANTSANRHKPAPVNIALPLQRVDDGIRSEADVEMDALKARTTLMLDQLAAKAENWSAKWGDKAKKAAEDKVRKKLDGEKGESIEKQAVKKIWAQLTFEEKAEIVTESAKAALTVFGTVAREATLPPMPSSSDNGRKPRDRRQPREESRSSGGVNVLESLSALTKDDAEMAYEFLKAYRKTRKHIEEAKDKIVETAGLVGKATGEMVGTFRDEHEFENLIKAHHDEFRGAFDAFIALEQKVTSNGDKARYQDELDMLHNALRFPGGPRVAFTYGGGIIEAKRLAFPAECRKAASDINAVWRTYSGMEKVAKNLNKLRFGGVDSLNSQVAVNQEKAASAIRAIARQSWKKVTKVWSTPGGVGKIRKLDETKSGAAYLADAKAKAAAAGAPGKYRDTEVTQPFYTAVAGVSIDNVQSLTAMTRKVNGLATLLASKG